MTRQKKEIMKKIDEIDEFIYVDQQLGCGMAPAGAYDGLYLQKWTLYEQLAKLQHYPDVMTMLNDIRGCGENW
jgi:hypothetical protein